jgi:mono/diheme cytochrome c family protein
MRTFLIATMLVVLSAGAGSAADAKAGKIVYDKSCKSCHGADGTPNPAIEKMLKVQMWDLKSKEVQSRSDADLRKADVEGEGKMKPVSGITGAAVDDLLAYVRSLGK